MVWQVVVGVMLVAHWFACIFALSASMHVDPRHTYWYRSGFCSTISESHTFIQQCNLEVSEFYVACFTYGGAALLGTPSSIDRPLLLLMRVCVFVRGRDRHRWAVLIVTGTGGTDNFPNEHSTSENIMIIIVGLSAALIWTTVLALFCAPAPTLRESRITDAANRRRAADHRPCTV